MERQDVSSCSFALKRRWRVSAILEGEDAEARGTAQRDAG